MDVAHYTELSLTAQTAYAQLFEAALAAEHLRSVADLSGSFAAKTVKGHKYWYFQYTEPSGKLRQIFVGPEGDAVRQLMNRKVLAGGMQSVEPLARSALALGCAGLLPRHFRVLRRLADYGFFRAGGVLIGTHAFLAYGNMLGVRWGEAERTQDLDFAHAGKSVALLLPSNLEINLGDAIESLNMGFLPITALASPYSATFLNPKEPDFRLDFLTTLHRGGEETFVHPQLRIALQPLRFMEFSLEDVQQAAMIGTNGAVIANVPHPARYALHKLLVFGERIGSYATKSRKDLVQAAQLIAYLSQHRPDDLDAAWKDLMGRGRQWVARARQGLTALAASAPELKVSERLRVPVVRRIAKRS